MLLLPYTPRPPAAPLVFDAVGDSWVGAGGNPWSHTATAGAYALAVIAGVGITGCTYDVTSMTLLGSSPDTAGGTNYLFGLAGVSGGAKTLTPTGTVVIDANTVSYTGVTSVGTPQNYQSPSTTLFSQSVTCTAGQIIVQSFENANSNSITSSTGGISRWASPTFTIRDATANTTFTATLSGADFGAGIAVVLS